MRIDLRQAALVALAAGAAGSLGLFLRAGRRTPGPLLVIMFCWVMSPFVALAWASVASKRWSPPVRSALHSVMLVVALGSLTAYAWDAARPREAQPAAFYVAVPPAGWLLGAVALSTAAIVARRRARTRKGD